MQISVIDSMTIHGGAQRLNSISHIASIFNRCFSSIILVYTSEDIPSLRTCHNLNKYPPIQQPFYTLHHIQHAPRHFSRARSLHTLCFYRYCSTFFQKRITINKFWGTCGIHTPCPGVFWPSSQRY